MPIRVVDFPEPHSRASGRLTEDTAAIRSDAWRVLTAELERYCSGHLRGRSFLVSGHRGAGKTTLVLHAHEHVRKRRERSGEARPLLVAVNGPALFRTEPPAATRAGKDTPAGQSPAQTSNGQNPPGQSPPAGNQPGQNPPAQNQPAKNQPAQNQPSSTAPKAGDGHAEPWQDALKQIVLALHRAVAEEMCEAHRQRVLDTTPSNSRMRRELLELSAQLEMELFECPMPSRLREFWDRAGLLEAGVLFQPDWRRRPARIFAPAPSRPADQGIRELVALAGVCEAYCRVSGTFTGEETRNESASREASASADVAPSPLVAPAVSLLTGALVGVGSALANASGTGAAAAGVGTALASAAVFKLSGKRTSARTVTRELNFMPDLSVRTLDRFLPLLVDRLIDAGLPPVFLIDELDKVDDLTQRMVGLLGNLKKVFAETAFFCFVTDRHYFEELRQVNSGGAYPPSSTYFSDQLFVVYGHDDLHRHLRRRVPPPQLPPS